MSPRRRWMVGIFIGSLILSWTVLSRYTAQAARSRLDWEEVLGPSKAQWPPPRERVGWPADLEAAMRRAQEQNRPLFVTMRCLPCKQCSAFDKNVLSGGPELDPLLKQFVTVRLTTVADIDLRLFPVEKLQDMDLSWWGWFLTPQGQVLSVFGGRDHVSDATRISPRALANTMRRVLDYYYDPRRPAWGLDGAAPDLSPPARTPQTLPGWKPWVKKRRPPNQPEGCLHCHQLAEVLRQPAIDQGTFDKDRDLQVWPLPENVGIVLDRDDGLKVLRVLPGSSAAKAGIRPGDILGAAEGRRLFGQADFRAVLHQGPTGAGDIEVVWVRGDRVMSGYLHVEPGWRRTVLDWRMSVAFGNIGAGPGFFPRSLGPRERERFGLPKDRMAVRPFMGRRPRGLAFNAGLRPNDIVTAVDGESPDLIGRAFLVWFRLRHDPGDSVTLSVRDPGGHERTIRYTVRASRD